MCISDDVIEYAWSTSIYSGIKISKGIYNSEIVAEQYIDTLKVWENRLEAVENSIGSSGISPIVKVTTLANGHRVEITDANGTKVFDVLNGKDGANGTNGADGKDGSNGIDGVSPTLSVSEITGGHRVTITDVNGTQSFDVMDGQDGRDGQNSVDGSGVTEDRVIELINSQLGLLRMALINKLTAIADAIRSKTGTTEPMTLDEMVTAIANITTGSVPSDTIILDDGTELPKPTLKDGCNYAMIFKNSNYYSMLETSNRFANVNSSYTIGTSSAVCYLSRLPVNFNEFNSWSEPTKYDLSNASFTTLGTLILSNEIIEKWSSISDNTKVIYFNKNCEL